MMCVHPDRVQFPFPCTDIGKKVVKPADVYEYAEGIILVIKNFEMEICLMRTIVMKVRFFLCSHFSGPI